MPKKIPKAKRISKLIKAADKLWSEKVRERDGYVCQVSGCGKSPAFAHHIFSRRHYSTRWDIENGFTICWGHHKMGHVDHEWLRDQITCKTGLEVFEILKCKAREVMHGKRTEFYLMEVIRGLKGEEGD